MGEVGPGPHIFKLPLSTRDTQCFVAHIIPEGFSEACGRLYSAPNKLSWQLSPSSEHLLKREQSSYEYSDLKEGWGRKEK